MTFEEYKNLGGINASILKTIYSESALSTLYPGARTETMAKGTAFHCYILEPERFNEEYYIFPSTDSNGVRWDGRNKTYKEHKKLVEELYPNKIILSAEEVLVFSKVKERLELNNVFKNHLTGGVAEETITTLNLFDGVMCKSRFDYIRKTDSKVYIYDLKSTVSANPYSFANQASKLKYDLAASFYVDVVKKELKVDDVEFIWIACELKEPYHTALYSLNPAGYKSGKLKYQSAFDKYSKTVMKGLYPGYPAESEPQPLELPAWSIITEE